MKACVIIPARFSSSRFPGKPLVKLLGKSMILWVAQVSSKAVGNKNVYIATDDERIYKTVQSAGFSAIMTSNKSLTGTDRVAEASKALDYDIFINVQGDEPLIDYNDIKKCIDLKSKYPDYVINGFSKINGLENPSSINIPKVVTNEKNFMLYMSRQLIPGHKSNSNKPIFFNASAHALPLSKETLRSADQPPFSTTMCLSLFWLTNRPPLLRDQFDQVPIPIVIPIVRGLCGVLRWQGVPGHTLLPGRN